LRRILTQRLTASRSKIIKVVQTDDSPPTP
jgi:hypothetical protein